MNEFRSGTLIRVNPVYSVRALIKEGSVYQPSTVSDGVFDVRVKTGHNGNRFCFSLNGG